MVKRMPGDAAGGVADRPAARLRRGAVRRLADGRGNCYAHRRHGGLIVNGGLAVPDTDLARERGLGADHVPDDLIGVPAATARPLPQLRRGNPGDVAEGGPRSLDERG
jgi:hypothetical protein